MHKQAAIRAAKLQAKLALSFQVLIDWSYSEGAVGRCMPMHEDRW